MEVRVEEVKESRGKATGAMSIQGARNVQCHRIILVTLDVHTQGLLQYRTFCVFITTKSATCLAYCYKVTTI